jgi:hypothetical protein
MTQKEKVSQTYHPLLREKAAINVPGQAKRFDTGKGRGSPR